MTWIWIYLQIAVLEESMKTFDEETKDLQLQHEQVQSSLRASSFSLLALCLSVFHEMLLLHLCPGTDNSESLQYEQRQTAEESGDSQRGEQTATGKQCSGRTSFECLNLPSFFNPEQPVHIME